MNILTFLLMMYWLRTIVYLLYVGLAQYPRAIERKKRWEDVISIFVSLGMIFWILVEKGIVNL